jgi:O-antigen/teichoic acid export membrane protein
MGKTKQFFLILGTDRAVLSTMAIRIWSASAGLLTSILVAKKLNPEMQGVYYTFLSIILFQQVFELGFITSISQFCSHEMARLEWSANGYLIGPLEAKRRVQSVVQLLLLWFGIAAVAILVGLLGGGLTFFKSTPNPVVLYLDIAIPWVLLVTCSVANLFVTAALAVLEGCGRVGEVLYIRLMQSIFSYLIGWFILYNNGGLYIVVGISFGAFVIGFSLVLKSHKAFFIDLFNTPKNLPGVNWALEIWPFQWRMGVSWICGAVLVYIVNPWLYRTQGPVAAGKMGMSLQILNGLNGLAIAWISSKMPLYGKLIGQGKRAELDTLFFTGLTQSSFFIIIMVCGLIFGLSFIKQIDEPFYNRFLEVRLLSLLGVGAVVNHIIHSQALYLRAHRQEPFMVVSLISALAFLIAAYFLVPIYGAGGMVYSSVGTAVFVSLISGTLVFHIKRKEWAAV